MTRGAYLMSLGLEPYGEALELQRSLAGAVSQGAIPETVLLLEHPPVVTIGRRTEADRELHVPEGADVEIAETDRGGKSTFHGPGQLVCYPILDLRHHGKDVKLYVRNLEEALLRTLAGFALEGVRYEGLTGVWMPPRRRQIAASGASLTSGEGRDSADARPARQSDAQRRKRLAEPGSARREPSAAGGGEGPRKIASIGVHVSRWVTTHGYALNVDLDPAPFTEWITACGLEDAAFTTMASELGKPLTVDEVRPAAVEAIAEVFELDFDELPADDGAGLWLQRIHTSLAAR
jgi:lipoyl(octanoyl) transferase